jgi:CDP-diglyceride synthetase
MTLVFFALALVVGAVCGAALGFELRPDELKVAPGRSWLALVGVAVVVSLCAVAVESINKTEPPSDTVKALCLLAVALAFGGAFKLTHRKG